MIPRDVDDASRSDSTKIQTRMDVAIYLIPSESVREPGIVANKEVLHK